jgi:hypothetical protein
MHPQLPYHMMIWYARDLGGVVLPSDGSLLPSHEGRTA